MRHANDFSHTDHILLEQGEIIFLQDGKLDNGEPYYLYLAVQGTKLKEYFSMLNCKRVSSLDEFKQVGAVIAAGKGSPSEELKQYLFEKYGITVS